MHQVADVTHLHCTKPLATWLIVLVSLNAQISGLANFGAFGEVVVVLWLVLPCGSLHL